MAATVGVGASGNVPSTSAVADDSRAARARSRPAAPSRPGPGRPAQSPRPCRSRPPPPRRATSPETPKVSRRTDRGPRQDRRGRDALRALGGQVAEVAARNGISKQQLVRTLTAGRHCLGLPPRARSTSRSRWPRRSAVPSRGPSPTRTSTPAARSPCTAVPAPSRSIVIDADGALVQRYRLEHPPHESARARAPGPAGTATAGRTPSPHRARLGAGGLAPGLGVVRRLRRRRHHRQRQRRRLEAHLGHRHRLRHPRRDHQRPDGRQALRRGSAASGRPSSAPSGGSTPRPSTSPRWSSPTAGRCHPIIAAQTVTHEAGHTLGLRHDGIGTETYHQGSPLWGPIMGAGMTRAISQLEQGRVRRGQPDRGRPRQDRPQGPDRGRRRR